MTKKLLLSIFLFMLLAQGSYGQYFQGVIIYKREYTAYNPSVSIKELEKLYSTTLEYYVKDGNYKSIVKNGDSIVAIHTFRQADYKMYSQVTAEPEVMVWDDYKRISDTLVKSEIKQNYDQLMGESCDLLTMETTRSTNHYLLSVKYRIDPQFFQAHQYGLYKQQVDLSKGRLPLEIIHNYPTYGEVLSALSITEKLVGDDFFEVATNKILIPADALLEKLPEPVGGLKVFYKHISKTLRYPSEAHKRRIQGKTVFNFIIDEQGNLTHLKSVASIGYGCDQEAEKAIISFPGKWEPALLKGQKVISYVSLPIAFKLN